MASVHNRMGFPISKPYEANIIAQLEQCKEEITRLELRLTEQRKIKATLEETLASVHKPISAFSRIPDEILVYIFFESIRGDPMAIGRVLLVCRRWNNVVNGTPSLWTNIVSNLRPDPAWIVRATKYVEKAIQNSGSLPLNVTMKLLSPTDMWKDIAEKIYLPSSVEVDKHEYDEKSMDTLDWLESAGNRYLSNLYVLYCQFPPYEKLCNVMSTHIDTFKGEDEANLGRIRSLSIFFNSNNHYRWCNKEEYKDFYLLHQFMPAPERLSLMDEAIDEAIEYFPFNNEIYIHPIPNLNYLSWKAAYSPNQVLVDDGQLIHLRFYWWITQSSFYTMSSNLPSHNFTRNLRQLFLDCGEAEVEVGQDRENLVFPLLDDLALAGRIHKTIIEAFTAPRLSTLRLVDYSSCDTTFSHVPHFQSLNKLHINNVIYIAGETTITRTLELFPSISELGILGSSVESVKECLSKIRAEELTVSIKGYKYSEESFWEFESYEQDEILINS